MTIRLTELRRGQKARVINIGVDAAAAKLLADSGLINGSEITMDTIYALDDPVQIRTSNRDLSLRREIASLVEVAVLSQPLSTVDSGKTAIICNIIAGPDDKRRLSDMGLIPNAQIRVLENRSPGPLLLEAFNSRLVLSAPQAEQIMVMVRKT